VLVKIDHLLFGVIQKITNNRTTDETGAASHENFHALDSNAMLFELTQALSSSMAIIVWLHNGL